MRISVWFMGAMKENTTIFHIGLRWALLHRKIRTVGIMAYAIVNCGGAGRENSTQTTIWRVAYTWL